MQNSSLRMHCNEKAECCCCTFDECKGRPPRFQTEEPLHFIPPSRMDVVGSFLLRTQLKVRDVALW